MIRPSLPRALRLHVLLGALALAAACGTPSAIHVQDRQQPEPHEPPANAAAEDLDVANGWRRISPETNVESVAVTPDGRVILIGQAGRGQASFNAGQDWVALDWPGDLRSTLATNPSGVTFLVGGIGAAAGLESTVLWSPDAGNSWTDTGREGRPVSYWRDDLFLVGGTSGGLLATPNGGLTGHVFLDAASLQLDIYEPMEVVTRPGNDGDIAVISVSEGGSVRIVRTRNSGVNVEEVAADFDLWGRTVLRYAAGERIYIFSQGVGVLVSDDDGDTWALLNAGIAGLASDGRYAAFSDLAVVTPASGAQDVVLGGVAGLYRLTRDGWQSIPAPPGAIRAFATRDGAPSPLLIGTSEGLWERAGVRLGGR